jgi:HAD superfamily hydrolase (TIGR01549 family)
MIALFDIGSTLIEGPNWGPARRLTEMLSLDVSAVADVERLLFRTPAESPEDLASHIATATRLPLPRVSAACGELWNAQLKEAYVLPGAQEAIARLRATGVQRAYLSNIWPPFYEHFRQRFLTEADQPQFLSFRMGLSKPDPAFFAAALSALNTKPSDVVMIGDTYVNDIRPAIEMGMRTVWVLHRPHKETKALVQVLNGTAPRPDITLHSIADLQLEHIL